MRQKTAVILIIVASGVAVSGWLALRSGKTNGQGRELAQKYCQSCHLFPEPELLDKASWTNGALPDMARWLGLAPADLDPAHPNSPADSQALHPEDGRGFPSSPLITDGEWKKVVRYYAEAAPERLISQKETKGTKIEPETRQFRVKELAYRRKIPMTFMVHVDAGTRRLYVGDALTHTIEALAAPVTDGAVTLPAPLTRIFTVEFDSGPVSIMPRGDWLDLTVVGRAFPSDLKKGKLLRLRPSADAMKIDKLLDNLRRPVHCAAADLNGDGREDFVVSQFGHHQGQLSWFEARPVIDGAMTLPKFEEHILIERPGAIRTEVRDMNNDGRPDIFALMGQAWEGVYLFLNEGGNLFKQITLVQQHPAFGYSYFELADFDNDGDLDLLTTNGDNGDSVAVPKPYHGIRIYLNNSQRSTPNAQPVFTERWFFPLHGAYGARARDFDLDGDLDIAAISYFPDYAHSPEESFVYLENRGNFTFKASSIPQHAAGRWITMDAGDLDGDGDADIVLGSLVLGPPRTPVPPAIRQQWTNGTAPAVLLLENTQK